MLGLGECNSHSFMIVSEGNLYSISPPPEGLFSYSVIPTTSKPRCTIFVFFFPKLAILHYKIVITLQMNFEFFNSTKSTLSIFIQWFDRVGRFSDKEALAARSIEHYLMNSSFFL